MFVKARQGGDDDGKQIEKNKQDMVEKWKMRGNNIFKVFFNLRTEKKQNQHVDNQMHPVGMQKTMGEQTIYLPSVINLIGIELKFGKQGIIPESNDGDKGSKNQQQICHGSVVIILCGNCSV
jgi:hypothetical protein